MTCSVLGYGLLPVIALAGLSVVLRLKTFPVVGAVLATAAIAWSTFAAARLFDAKVREKTPPWNTCVTLFTFSHPTLLIAAGSHGAVLAGSLPRRPPLQLLRTHHRLLNTEKRTRVIKKIMR
jgi:hypothetical protein